MLNTTTYLPKLKEFEGAIPYMYLDTDTPGNVTVGVGNMLPNADAAKKLAFQMRADPTAKPPILVPRPATAEEIQADFESVKKQTAAKVATYYKQFTKLDLPDTVIDSLLTSRVTEFKVGLIASFPDFNLYPEEACAALFDMAFNVGPKFTTQFATFSKAVKAQDWVTAAKECHRVGPPDSRNDWTKAQFDKVAADAKAAQDAKDKAAAGSK
jgi:GH24 family phage-related lysozyme (muramidase)